MADYSDLMKLEKQAKQSSPSVPSPLPINQTTPQELAGKPANLQAGKPTNMQTSKPVNLQARLHANLQAGKPAKPEKYSSYLPGQYKKRLKQKALDTDRKEYEILQEAIELYFRTLDEKK